MFARIGNNDYSTTTTVSPNTGNAICGTIMGEVSLRSELLRCGGTKSGQFLDLQIGVDSFLEVDNVYVCENNIDRFVSILLDVAN